MSNFKIVVYSFLAVFALMFFLRLIPILVYLAFMGVVVFAVVIGAKALYDYLVEDDKLTK